MKKPKPKLHNIVYLLIGVIYMLIGTGAIFVPSGVLPAEWIVSIYGSDISNSLSMHMILEFGAALLALGSVFLWRARHSRYSPTFHWGMTTYFIVDAMIHWLGPDDAVDSLPHDLINTAPFLLMMILVGALQYFHRDSEHTNSAGVLPHDRML